MASRWVMAKATGLSIRSQLWACATAGRLSPHGAVMWICEALGGRACREPLAGRTGGHQQARLAGSLPGFRSDRMAATNWG